MTCGIIYSQNSTVKGGSHILYNLITCRGSIPYLHIFIKNLNLSLYVSRMTTNIFGVVFNKFLLALIKLFSLMPGYLQKISPFSLETTHDYLLKLDICIYKSGHKSQFLIFYLPHHRFFIIFLPLGLFMIQMCTKNFHLFKHIPLIFHSSYCNA